MIVLCIIFAVVCGLGLLNIDTGPGKRVVISYIALFPAYGSIFIGTGNVFLVIVNIIQRFTKEKNGKTAIIDLLLVPVVLGATFFGIMVAIALPNEMIGQVMNVAGNYPDAMLSATISTILADVGTLGVMAIVLFFTWKREVLPKIVSMLLVNTLTPYYLYGLIFNLTFEKGWVFYLTDPRSFFRNWW